MLRIRQVPTNPKYPEITTITNLAEPQSFHYLCVKCLIDLTRMSDVILTKYECNLQDTQEVQLLVTETTPRIFCIQEKKNKTETP